MFAFQIIVPTATRFAECFEPLEQRRAQAFRHSVFSKRTPTAREATEVHKVQLIAFAKGLQKLFNRIEIRLRLKHRQRIQSEHSIIKVTPPRAILEATIGILLPPKKFLNQLRRFP